MKQINVRFVLEIKNVDDVMKKKNVLKGIKQDLLIVF